MKRVPRKIINKHNSLTDANIPKPPKQVLPDRLINALYYKYEKEGIKFKISLKELKHLLGLENEKDNNRIYQAIATLQQPIQIRDFKYKNKKISWISSPFLAKAVIYKDVGNFIEFTIEPMILEAIKQKIGFTPLDIDICNKFKSKYGLKLYEMYRRYYTLPHKEKVASLKIGRFKKSIEEINFIFGSSYKYPSQALRAIKRGLKEIEEKTDIFINCYFDKEEKLFIFSWERDIRYPSQKCIIPLHQIDAFVNWYASNVIDESNIIEVKNYKKLLKEKVISNSLYNIERFYIAYLEEIGKNPCECFNKKLNKFIC